VHKISIHFIISFNLPFAREHGTILGKGQVSRKADSLGKTCREDEWHYGLRVSMPAAYTRLEERTLKETRQL